jgi:hypothetical protein
LKNYRKLRTLVRGFFFIGRANARARLRRIARRMPNHAETGDWITKDDKILAQFYFGPWQFDSNINFRPPLHGVRFICFVPDMRIGGGLQGETACL